MQDEAPDYLTVDQVAATLQVAPQAVRRWIQRGELLAYRLGGQRMGYRIARDELAAFMQRHQRGPATATDDAPG